MEIHGLAGKPLTLIARDEFGNVAKVESAMPLAKAEKHPADGGKIARTTGPARRHAVQTPRIEKFAGRRSHAACEGIEPPAPRNSDGTGKPPRAAKTMDTRQRRDARGAETNRRIPDSARPRSAPESNLIVLVRNLTQLEAALKCGVTTVYCEFEDPKKYREAVTYVSHRHAACCDSILHPPFAIIAAAFS